MRKRGLEPPRISPPDSNPGAATDYATCAVGTPGSAPGLTNYKLAALLIKLCPLVSTVYRLACIWYNDNAHVAQLAAGKSLKSSKGARSNRVVGSLSENQSSNGLISLRSLIIGHCFPDSIQPWK